MMYPYITLPDGTEIVHSHLMIKNKLKTIEVHFERPKPHGFVSARISLPSYKWIIKDGFSDDEIKSFEDFTLRHAHTLYHYAESGGIPIA